MSGLLSLPDLFGLLRLLGLSSWSLESVGSMRSSYFAGSAGFWWHPRFAKSAGSTAST